MNKRLLALTILLLTALVLYFFKGIIPGVYLNLGKNAYLAKDYKNAYQLLKISVHLNPKSTDARYYFVQTMLNLAPTLDVQKEMFSVSQENLADSADLIADSQIEKWKQQIFLYAGENYIEKVPFNDMILRWDAKKFPLKVSFSNEANASIPAYYESSIKAAFAQWQNTTGNFVRFKFVDKNDKDAQIFVKIVPSGEMNKCDQEDCKYVVAYTTPILRSDFLKAMEIKFYDLNNLNQPFSQREIYNTALHEIGHSLGIMGHSPNKDDLMYMENNLDENYNQYRSDFQLISPIDKNTLMLLYKLIPNITNTDLSQFDTSHQFYAPIVLGSEKEISSRKLTEAQGYIKSAPNIPNGYVDLASAYTEQKEYSKAIDAMQKALDLSTNDSEKYLVYYNLAVIYMNIKDWETSLKYANMAKNIQSSSDIDGLIALLQYNMGDKKAAKETYIASLAQSPDNIVNALNLSKIYLKEFNYVQAGRTLNALVKANPQAKENPQVRIFGWLMFLFR